MGVPKRRTSKARRDKRRTHDSLSIPSWSNCPNCSEPTRAHYVCAKCGFYKGKQIVEVKQ
ncbi:MAG TPA: 50S ribosomal protein L32 [Candidatus Cloacimonadota bacterium]|jgi:large subunit ribosomal protein L32|nr:50S ribosomal protein L32 [Candidatus Cloacimonadota bacterium]HPM02012.1 50S ribosomal protein L32 [Candidatus Cloacimonadota bacterium]